MITTMIEPPSAATANAVVAMAGAAAPPQRKRWFWTMPEVRIIEEHYPAGGVEACMERLPHRERGAIYQKAAQLGLRSPATQKPFRERWTTSEQLDAAIRRVYQSDRISRGVVNKLADTIGRPRWWVKKRAAILGLVAPRMKEPAWTESEIEILEEYGHRHPETIRRRLAHAGFKRTTTAVVVKMKRLQVDRTDYDHFTATALSKMLGVDGKVVTGWIAKGWLKAKRRGTDRTDVQGGDQWWIHRRDVRAFVVGNAAAVDLRKIVDKEWFIDLLANGGR